MKNQEELAVQQFKMSNGDEIVCIIDEWGESDFVVKYALKMVEVPYDPEDTNRAFMFRPWMNYQDNFESTIVLCSFNVVAFYEPSTQMIEGYLDAVAEVKEYFKETEYKTKLQTRKRSSSKAIDTSEDSDSLTNVVSLFDDKPSIH